MILTLKQSLNAFGTVISLEDKTGRKYFQTLDADKQGAKQARTWAKNNKFVVV